MKTKSSGDAARPRRQIPLRFSHFATKGEIRRESSGGREVVAVDLRRRNFASSGSIIETAALSFYWADQQWRPVDSARVDPE